MVRKSKRCKQIQDMVDTNKTYGLEEAVEVLKKVPAAKFDESVDISIKLTVDPKKADQQVRGTVSLPHGSGKKSCSCSFRKRKQNSRSFRRRCRLRRSRRTN